ncbi:protein FAM227A isoform X2 [Protopterus annectens]|uniref:protein FAM227A isoform X2 n=1 Tax=Protopterus annectens TaxID=7888 RepID=UPI001CFA2E9E|nr:protein FAM227A isoform X2 [Protopterus annectens]
MADINRISSPVTIFQEDLYKSPIKSEKMKEMLCKEAKSPALFLIGSIEKVNQKVLNLELELERCRDVLVIESRQEEDEEKHQPGPSPWGADSDIDKKELKIFSQKYAKRAMQMLNLESRFYGTRSTRQRIEVKPKLVELQQFPGINKHDVTPLPNNTSLDNVIEKVILAQKDLKRKHHYHKEFCNLFNFPTVRAILLDAFWWIFLYKYQPDLASQNFLFDRIAENYIQLMTDCRSIQYGEVFLKALPGILCQAVYSCFCCSFPQSGLQFDSDDFKRDLCNTLHEWIGGIRPSLGIYRKWEYSTLEPQGMRKELMPTKGKYKKGLTLSFQPTEKAISSLVPLIDDPKSHRTQRLRSISQTKMHSKNLDHYSRIPDEVSLYQTTVTQSCPSLELPEYSSKENITASEAQTMQGKLNQVQHSMTEVAESKQDSSNTLQSRKEVPKPGSTANIKEESGKVVVQSPGGQASEPAVISKSKGER